MVLPIMMCLVKIFDANKPDELGELITFMGKLSVDEYIDLRKFSRQLYMKSQDRNSIFTQYEALLNG